MLREALVWSRTRCRASRCLLRTPYSTMRRHGVTRIGVLLIDKEGLDCEVVAAQPLRLVAASGARCARAPSSSRSSHCTKQALADAQRALRTVVTLLRWPRPSSPQRRPSWSWVPS